MKYIDMLAKFGIDPPVGGYRPASERAVGEVEDLLGRSLPGVYRDFLLEVGECGFTENFYISPKSGRHDLILLSLYGIDEDVSSYNNIHRHIRYDDDVPTFLPLGSDPFGGTYLIEVTSGEIYFRDGHSGAKSLVAHDFEEFVDRMKLSGYSL